MDTSLAPRCNIKKRIRVSGKWTFAPVDHEGGKPRLDRVVLDGVPTKSKDGTFYIEWRENGKRIQKPVGGSPRAALDAYWLQVTRLRGGAVEEEEPEETAHKTTVAGACAAFLKDVRATKSDQTIRAYDRGCRWFQANCTRHYASHVTRDDLMSLFAAGRSEGLNQKTINRNVLVALMALRRAGVAIRMEKGDWPKTSDKLIESYSAEEVIKFLAACDEEERLLFSCFLASGFRSREMATLTFRSVNSKHGTLGVEARPEYRFKPKSHEEREVPVPLSLVRKLEKRKEKSSSRLVFPTAVHCKRPNYGGDSPDDHHLELCKEIAFRAGLNCGRCKTAGGRCKDGPYCEHWTPHKWRHTFATDLLRDGVDIQELKLLMGHSDIKTTERYLQAVRLGSMRAKIESTSIAGMIG